MQDTFENSGHHFVAVFGGSVAGSEAAYQLSQRGFRVVVFDQNPLPYGKIEDGLPKWHAKLRDKEEESINEKLDHPNIRFVPGIKLGRDIQIKELVENWGFSAILLAIGAWKDRRLSIPNIKLYENKGLIYQNPFIYWFNHNHEKNYSGPKMSIKDGTVIIGGGLASLDVVKIVMIELVQKALAKRGKNVDLFTLEKGIDRVLGRFNLGLEDLGLRGCTLTYRRRAVDMPLTVGDTSTQEELVKAQLIREKILYNFQRKYMFRFEPCLSPKEIIGKDGNIESMVFTHNEIGPNGKITPSNKTKAIKTRMAISSIGSIPESIEDLPIAGSVFDMENGASCKIKGYDNVFAIGNAVTGRGNIKESLEHGRYATLDVMENHLQWMETDFQDWLRGTETSIEKQIESISGTIYKKDSLSSETVNFILEKTRELQLKSGMDCLFREWIQKNLPERLEDQLNVV